MQGGAKVSKRCRQQSESLLGEREKEHERFIQCIHATTRFIFPVPTVHVREREKRTQPATFFNVPRDVYVGTACTKCRPFDTGPPAGVHDHHHADHVDERYVASTLRLRARVSAGGHHGAHLGGRARLLLPSRLLPERFIG